MIPGSSNLSAWTHRLVPVGPLRPLHDVRSNVEGGVQKSTGPAMPDPPLSHSQIFFSSPGNSGLSQKRAVPHCLREGAMTSKLLINMSDLRRIGREILPMSLCERGLVRGRFTHFFSLLRLLQRKVQRALARLWVRVSGLDRSLSACPMRGRTCKHRGHVQVRPSTALSAKRSRPWISRGSS